MRCRAVSIWLMVAFVSSGATITITNDTLPTSQTSSPAASSRQPDAWATNWLAIVNDLRAKSGRQPLRLDAQLTAGATAQARLIAETPASQRHQIPSQALLEALWQAGTVDGNPVWRVIALPAGSNIQAGHAAFKAIAELDASHLGLGAIKQHGTHWVVATAVQRRVELSGLRAGTYTPYASFWLRGRVLSGAWKPRLLLTPPDGQVQELPLTVSGDRFEQVVSLAGQGRYMAEIMVDSAAGPAVAALLPLDVGPAPTRPAARRTDGSVAGMSLPAMRAKLLELLNADRARHGLPPLRLSERLSTVAQGHSEDMAQHRFFAHVSPRHGDLLARVRRAGLPEQTLGENIAMASSLEEAEENLMASPGHRAMILSPEMRVVGFGVVVRETAGGRPQLWVTQNFGTKGP